MKLLKFKQDVPVNQYRLSNPTINKNRIDLHGQLLLHSTVKTKQLMNRLKITIKKTA